MCPAGHMEAGGRRGLAVAAGLSPNQPSGRDRIGLETIGDGDTRVTARDRSGRPHRDLFQGFFLADFDECLDDLDLTVLAQLARLVRPRVPFAQLPGTERDECRGEGQPAADINHTRRPHGTGDASAWG